MSTLVSQQPDEVKEDFNLGAMLLIALAAVLGTTITVWIFHFVQTGTPAPPQPLPRVAVLPFHSLSASKVDLRSDEDITNALLTQLAHVSHIEVLPAEMDTDPLVVGRELGVKGLLIGKVERVGGRLNVSVQLIGTRDGKQLWAGNFNGNSKDLSTLSQKIHKAVAPYLTALLD
jgi:TolB-like protein